MNNDLAPDLSPTMVVGRATQKVAFQDLVFGETFADVQAKMGKFKDEGPQSENIHGYSGKVAGLDAEIFLIFTPTSRLLWRVGVEFIQRDKVSWIELRDAYHFLVGALAKKYGPPAEEFSFFSAPGQLGDGCEMEYVREDLCNYAQLWHLSDGGIFCTIASHPSVSLRYESESFSAIATHEKEQLAVDEL